MKEIGVLALQGDFAEHEAALRHLGVNVRQVRKPEHLAGLEGLIIPGGESTTLSRLIQDYLFLGPLQKLTASGVPVWGTCAGMILMAAQVDSLNYPTLGVINIAVERNGYGRQVNSFQVQVPVEALGKDPFPAIFIRAPLVAKVGPGVRVLAQLPREDGIDGNKPVIAVRQGDFLATAFHPELTEDTRFHEYFLEIVERAGRKFKGD
ncbi:MAG TPA: pyridoxal 5'-phosphate synthase glutaminase subunit PdxT [Dehalococcoidia bacterium]|nr:pyridoxal 5'-phosphate synthase glutaminase subunit PdxT [Dehalococcoidia bacterium]